jgi:excisionase family DNA binding protein
MLNPEMPLAAISVSDFQEMMEGYLNRIPSTPPAPAPPQSHKVEEKLVSATEMCQLANVARSTLYHARKDGRVPFYRMGRRILFKPSEVIEGLKQG